MKNACCTVLFAVLTFGAAAQEEIVGGPWLQNSRTDAITVMWETNIPSNSQVDYGLNAELGTETGSPGKTVIHEITLTGLTIETNYFYRVRSGNAVSEIFQFQTAVKPDTAFAYVVVGDNRTNQDNWARIAALAFAERPNLVLNVGDVVTKGSLREQWLEQWILPAADLMARVPMYVAIGNHEDDSQWFYDYVSYPKPEDYYSFDFGNAHFAMVDTNKPITPGSEQFEWLEKDLANSHATWKFVAHHHPPYSSDLNDYGDTTKVPSDLGDLEVRTLVALYEKYDVDVCWYGHIHSYERTWPLRNGKIDEEQGVVYIQTGGGGAPLEEFAPTRSWFTAKVSYNWQYCLVTMHGGTFRMMAYDIEGRMYDFLEIKK